MCRSWFFRVSFPRYAVEPFSVQILVVSATLIIHLIHLLCLFSLTLLLTSSHFLGYFPAFLQCALLEFHSNLFLSFSSIFFLNSVNSYLSPHPLCLFFFFEGEGHFYYWFLNFWIKICLFSFKYANWRYWIQFFNFSNVF